ncbi:MAG: tetratricopeptide repeat protein [Proteobacteria bacterium]|nr:tetratricopeptide repeat protein [Pseudomonadota bacterium]MBU1744356.1 tetratricopeptide repeat protein [Pseudomonadota bacterium]MBU1966606.1 tetratricopeptide repeat protein [Pseudomonadota bacterium]MBU4581836.1 tetratricopeptide repeat protein [Pseudomonadota bacterium]
MAAKMDKHELNEPDKLQLFFLLVRAFAEKHRVRIYAGGGIFILIALLASGWYLYRDHYQTSAGKIYNQIIEAAAKAGSPAGDAATIKGYKDLISQYPRSRAAAMANYRLGNLYSGRREYDAAISAYQEFLKNSSAESDLVTLTYNGLGACQEAKKDLNKALESYDMATKTSAASSFEVLNYSNIARVYEAKNDPAKAAEFYRKALDKTTDPLMTLYLKRKLAILG